MNCTEIEQQNQPTIMAEINEEDLSLTLTQASQLIRFEAFDRAVEAFSEMCGDDDKPRLQKTEVDGIRLSFSESFENWTSETTLAISDGNGAEIIAEMQPGHFLFGWLQGNRTLMWQEYDSIWESGL
ncbi:hypothetical protein ACQ4M3_00990 [Leptolyngbya sp. AN03gr2]|uniref:hypothetical protein n=1 Tax=unclassified Leptolyngbya TaxID=2650499 RepID=UPI003D319F5A